MGYNEGKAGLIMLSEKLKKIAKSGLPEWADKQARLEEKWQLCLAAPKEKRCLHIACDNGDYVFSALKEIKNGKKEIEAGISLLCKELEIEHVKFYLPEEEYGNYLPETEKLNFGSVKHEAVKGRVDLVALENTDLLHHIETAANIGRLAAGEKAAYYALVKSEEINKTVFADVNSSLLDILKLAAVEADDKTKVIAGGYFGSPTYAKDESCMLYVYPGPVIELVPESFCPVSYGEKAMAYAYKNSCGKCTWCREGTYQLWRFLSDSINGKGADGDVAAIGEISKAVAEQSLCSYGKNSVNFISRALEQDKDVFEAHSKTKRCPSDVCQSFVDYAVDGGLCSGCGLCVAACPDGAIESANGMIAMIDVFRCGKCGKCAEICPDFAIRKVRSGRLIGPVLPTLAGRFRSSRRNYNIKKSSSLGKAGKA